MNIGELKQHIKNNKVPRFLIFTGEDTAVMDIYIKQIAKITGSEVRYIDNVSKCRVCIKNGQFLSKSLVFGIVEDVEFLKQSEEIWTDVIKAIMTSKNYVILRYYKADARLKFFKTYKDSIVEFQTLPEATLERHIQKQIELSSENCKKLIDICGHNYGRIMLEVDKLAIGQKILNLNADRTFARFMKDKIIYVPPADAIFTLVDSILMNHREESFKNYQDCVDIGESSMAILTVLYQNVRAVLQVQTSSSTQVADIADESGLTTWQVITAKKKAGVRSSGVLVVILKLVEKVIAGIKVGTISEKDSVPYTMIRIFNM